MISGTCRYNILRENSKGTLEPACLDSGHVRAKRVISLLYMSLLCYGWTSAYLRVQDFSWSADHILSSIFSTDHVSITTCRLPVTYRAGQCLKTCTEQWTHHFTSWLLWVTTATIFGRTRVETILTYLTYLSWDSTAGPGAGSAFPGWASMITVTKTSSRAIEIFLSMASGMCLYIYITWNIWNR